MIIGLVMAIVMSVTGCSDSTPASTGFPNSFEEQVIEETVLIEDVEVEQIITETVITWDNAEIKSW